jgi:hypothetical protein
MQAGRGAGETAGCHTGQRHLGDGLDIFTMDRTVVLDVQTRGSLMLSVESLSGSRRLIGRGSWEADTQNQPGLAVSELCIVLVLRTVCGGAV